MLFRSSIVKFYTLSQSSKFTMLPTTPRASSWSSASSCEMPPLRKIPTTMTWLQSSFPLISSAIMNADFSPPTPAPTRVGSNGCRALLFSPFSPRARCLHLTGHVFNPKKGHQGNSSHISFVPTMSAPMPANPSSPNVKSCAICYLTTKISTPTK